MSIPIVSADKLNDLKGRTLFVPLAWNFFDEICARIKQKHDNSNDRFITYFPRVEVRS
jgi:hypothetical protein